MATELYQKKRDHLVESLVAVGLKPVVPKVCPSPTCSRLYIYDIQGSYFIVVDITGVKVPETENLAHEVDHRHDYNVCRYV